MGIIDFTMVHACQILNTSQDNRLNFTSGSVAFTPGATLTGSTSHASGTIKSVVLSSGLWSSGNAAGYLILYSVAGAFQSGESITDNNATPGTANVSGTPISQTNGVGTPSTTTQTLPSDSTYYECLFERISSSGNYITISDAGKVIQSSILCSLPARAIVSEGDFITTTEKDWKGTYEVQTVDAPEIPYTDTVDHKEAFLKKVVKRG